MQLKPSGTIKMLVLHGPNLNLLGLREPDVYGTVSFDELNRRIKERARDLGVEVTIQQSNHEGTLIDHIHDAGGWADAIIVNPGAYTHYSHAIGDALKAVRLPAIEVHLTNVHGREEWRRTSVIAPVVVGSICGFGPASYTLALDAALDIITQGRQ